MDSSKRIVTLVADPFPPYQYMKGSQITGLDYEIIKEAFKTQDREIAVALLPWSECLERMGQRRADGIFQITRSPDREEHSLFSDLLRTAKTVFYCSADKPMLLRENEDLIDQLRGANVGVVSGYSYGPESDNLQGIQRAPVENHEELLQRLAARKFDLAIMDQGVGVYAASKMHLEDKVQRLHGFEIERPLFVAFQKDGDEAKKTFNRGLERIRETGIYDGLFSKYGLKD